jgi:hypothetical protein
MSLDAVRRLRLYTSALLGGSVTPGHLVEGRADWFHLASPSTSSAAPWSWTTERPMRCSSVPPVSAMASSYRGPARGPTETRGVHGTGGPGRTRGWRTRTESGGARVAPLRRV